MAQATIHPRSAGDRQLHSQLSHKASAGSVPTIAYVRTVVATQAEADQGWRAVVVVSM